MPRFLLPTALAFALLLPLAACSGNRREPATATAQLAFGTSMAQRGLWQEALFRFNEAERLDPQNFRVHNNLGVAYEAAGDYEKALLHYKRALEIDPANRQAKANYARFVEFYQSFKGKPGDKKASASAAPTPARRPSPPPAVGGDPGMPRDPRSPAGVPPGVAPPIPPAGR